MARDRYRRRVGTKKPDHTVPNPRRHTPANRKGGGYRGAHIKGQSLPLKLGLGDALALQAMAGGRRRHAARHAAKPSSRPMVSRSRPIKTRRDCREPSGQAPMGAPSINMCTP